MSESLQSLGLQHPRLLCLSLSPRVCSDLCLLSQWCHTTISSSVVPFSSCLQSFPVSGFFPMSQFFSSGGQTIGASASASVLPWIFSWFPLGLTNLISMLFKGLSRVFSSTIVQRHQFFSPQIFSCPALTPIHDYWKNHNLDYMNLFPFRFRSFTHFSISLSAFLLLSCMSSLYILDIN